MRKKRKFKVTSQFLAENEIGNISDDKDHETHDFDLTKEKKPALSSMKANLRILDSRYSSTVPVGSFVQLFDKLKIAINLKQDGEYIEYSSGVESGAMSLSDKPEKVPSKQEENEQRQAMYLTPNIELKEHPNIDISDIEEDYAYQFGDYNKNFDNIEFIEEDNTETKNLISEEEIKDTANSSNMNLYPNCKISYDVYRENAGIINVYIKNDVLIIYLSGKFMAETGSLGYITRDNIEACLERVCQITGMSFDIPKAIEVAHVYLCDVCIDIHYKKTKDVHKAIRAMSSLFPLASNRHRILKYSTHGLKLVSKSKNAGSSLTLYSKEDVLSERGMYSRKRENYLRRIGELGGTIAKHTLRIECQIFKLNDMRVLLDLPKRQAGIVMLSDVLNSTATPILKRLKAFDASEIIFRDKIWNYIETEENNNTPIKTKRLLDKRLAAERVAELLRENDFDITKVKNHIITEFEINDVSLIGSLVTHIKTDLWNFLLYNKPKAIKIIIDLLDRVYQFYGRNTEEGEIDE